MKETGFRRGPTKSHRMVSNVKACLVALFAPRGFPPNFVPCGAQNYTLRCLRKHSQFKGKKQTWKPERMNVCSFQVHF